MKKAISVLGCVLFFLVVLLPLGVIVSDWFGYTLKLANYSVFAIVIALLSVSTAALSLTAKKPIENKAVEIFLALTAPFSLINTAVYLFECGTLLVAACMFICVCCCGYLSIRHGKPLAIKIICSVVSALLMLPIGVFGFIAMIFGDFGENTIVQSVESPNGAYYAEVIDSDQGALGGDTFVVVHEKGIDALLFKISKKPQRVYHGNWGEFRNMEIYWKDDHCLVINSVEYAWMKSDLSDLNITSTESIPKMNNIEMEDVLYIFEGMYDREMKAEVFIDTLNSVGIVDPSAINISEADDRVIVVEIIENDITYCVTLSAKTGYVGVIYKEGMDGDAIYYHTDD